MKRMGLNVAAEGISLGYAYTFLAQSGNLACMIIKVEDRIKAKKILNKNKIRMLTEEEVSEL
ncbi:MAG: hypothetical protein ACLRTF_07085 [Blautia sp.]